MGFFKKDKSSDNLHLPTHIAIIMDGNGRWAKKRGLPRSAGHKKGANTFRTIADYINELGIKYMTFYAFSTENWQRSATEVSAIMNLFREYLKEALERQDETDMRMVFIGDKSALDDDIVELMNEIERDSKDNKGAVVNLAINYGGRQEIVQSAKAIARKVKDGELSVDDIDEELINDNLYTSSQPYPDLIIRPSGEYRLSNFLIWQSAYSEFWFDDILWPDFSKRDLDRALLDYSKRQRRFGK